MQDLRQFAGLTEAEITARHSHMQVIETQHTEI